LSDAHPIAALPKARSSVSRHVLKVAKRGNNLAVIFPPSQAKYADLYVGAELAVVTTPEGVLLRPLRPRQTLRDLVAGITAKNRHEEAGLGRPVGRELI
jgi:antitoxin MazE